LTGEAIAFLVLGVFCCAKITLSALEASGFGSVEPAEATIIVPPKGPQWSKEEVKVLTALDARRAELEDRAARLEQREMEASGRDRDVAVRLTELKELSERLKVERDKGDSQRNAQLDQLANVYGSMNPPEAAHLLEQLDIQVALSLVQRLPEKRMGQILALMNAQRALELTNLLTKRPLSAREY
jgi:flagellar motility protein MotE (MotC chaperone)